MQELIIIGTIVLLAYLYSQYNKKTKRTILIAGIISFVWVSLSGIYNYSGENFTLFGVNLLSFLLWTTLLVLLKLFYDKVKWKDKFWKVSIVYILSLMFFEYIGYNILNIQLSSNYPGLFNLPLIHVPLFAKIYYLAIGPIFLKITEKKK